MEAGKRGRKTVVLEHARKPAEKVRISGGGRCNFTNINLDAATNFLSQNPRFHRSALARYTPQDFVSLVKRHGIAFYEKAHGQLFCDGSSQQIVHMLLEECREAGVQIYTGARFGGVSKSGDVFLIESSAGRFEARSFVVASGGLSIPKMGATGVGYDIARQFAIPIVPTQPALVPLTFSAADAEGWREMAGVSFPASVRCGKTTFEEAALFTHKGLSGPAILQISSYWRLGVSVVVDMAPHVNAETCLLEAKRERPHQEVTTAVSEMLPRRLAKSLVRSLLSEDGSRRLGQMSDRQLRALCERMKSWTWTPEGTEGYRIAEVTLGGVDTDALSSQTMECKSVPGLFFIGEVVDVTGHLGGFNFQWAWASGYAAGQAV